MGEGRWDRLLHEVRRLVKGATPDAGSDRHLLRRFADERDQSAFAALVERHGPMVYGVCRRTLQDPQDAEDAFQATFCVLARKAAAPGWHDSIGGWLYAVARRIAAKARARVSRARELERAAAARRPEFTTPPPDRETWALLDEELQRLPEKYRAPLVLCYLEGRTNEEAACELGWPKGTVQGRLARGRELLKTRLTRRQATLAAVALSALEAGRSQAAIPGGLADRTVHVSLQFLTGVPASGVSASVAALAEGALRSMWFSKLRVALLIAVPILVLGGVTAWAADRAVREAGAVVAAGDPKKEAATPADELEQFKAYLAKNHKGAKWQTGPARIENPALSTAYPGLRFYYVASSPPLPPGAPLPELLEAYRRKSAEYNAGNYISTIVSTDGKGVFTPVDYQRGLIKIASEDDARTAAAAVLALASPGSVPTAKMLQVTKSDRGWVCSQRIAFTGPDTVEFGSDGKFLRVHRVAPPILPPSVPPSGPVAPPRP